MPSRHQSTKEVHAIVATTAQPQASQPSFPRPSGKTLIAIVGVIAVVWSALGIQGAILGESQQTSDTAMQQQIDALKSGVAQSATLPVAVSDQASAQAYDATLPPVTAEPVKEIALTATDNTIVGVAKGVNVPAWSFGDSIPARPLHVRQGDTVRFTLTNNGSMGHSMDFHAAQIDPGQNYRTVLPGDSFTFTWTANSPGVFMFHCGSAPVLEHIAMGMYGAIVVDPATPLPPAREYVLVQSEWYLKQNGDSYAGDLNKMLAGTPDYVVFNGMVNQYQAHPLTAEPGELVRLYVVNAGPTLQSDFHVIGAIFSAVYPDGNPNNRLTGVQTYSVPPGGGATFELTASDPGTYPFVTHSFAAASKGALGVLQVGQPVASASTHDMSIPASSADATATAKVTVMAENNKFDQNTITVQAGQPVTLTLMNHDQALHNLHVIGLKGSDGKDVQTPLVEQGKIGSVTFTPAKPGTYKFQCDVHPADMTGTLIVK
jgi:copper-containing nitrite reductase